MATEKSLIYYGWLYHKLFDPPLLEARRLAIDLIMPGSTVLDIACGTRLLCTALQQQKQCKVIGIDLSLRMLEFAAKAAHHPDITLCHMDATDLSDFKDLQFDYATMLFLFHELPRDQQHRALTEAVRVARRVLVIDSNAPLPSNRYARGIRFVEATFGRDHNGNFKSFLARGGIPGILEETGLRLNTEHKDLFWGDSRLAVMVSGCS